MRFNCGKTHEARIAAKEKWHKFFALLPVTMEVDEKGNRRCAWLETVERKGKMWYAGGDYGWDWEYRSLRGEG